jgi:serine-protein kinase ATM
MSMISQHASLLNGAKIDTVASRQCHVEVLLLSSKIYRYHQASQESLNISTWLSDLTPICANLGLNIDAAAKAEVASSLWDYGETAMSIRILQGIERDPSIKKQSIPVSRSHLLSTLAHHVSEARLEKPHDIQRSYLEPALKELRGSHAGKEAGQVFHQFAVFCDEQLQDPASLEDLERLQGLRAAKSSEVAGLKDLIASTKDSHTRNKLSHALSKERLWLDLDEQELRRVEHTRAEFVRLSIENYLLSLIASDEHNNDALRFTALWLERSSVEATNVAVSRYLKEVPTRKFAGLMNQLTSSSS